MKGAVFGIIIMAKLRSVLSCKSINPNMQLCPWCWSHWLVEVSQIEGSTQAIITNQQEDSLVCSKMYIVKNISLVVISC